MPGAKQPQKYASRNKTGALRTGVYMCELPLSRAAKGSLNKMPVCVGTVGLSPGGLL